MMKVYVVHGAPMAGKSTYVREQMGQNDIAFDYDAVMAALSGLPVHGRNDSLAGYVLDIRDMIIARLKGEKALDAAWIITTRMTEKLKRSLIGLNAEYIERKIDIHTARQRLKDNPGDRDIEEWSLAIERYFAATADYSWFYKTKRWERKRMVVLKRDEFKCREAARFGQVAEANTVHHCIPITERPDLKLDERNLISLTEENHERMHIKYTFELSKLGKEWRERMLRRWPELSTPPA